MKKETSFCSGCGKLIDWNKNKRAFMTCKDSSKENGIAHWCSKKCYKQKFFFTSFSSSRFKEAVK